MSAVAVVQLLLTAAACLGLWRLCRCQTGFVYETPRSMTEKLNYVRAQGMRGMNFWTLSQTMDGAASPILETVLP